MFLIITDLPASAGDIGGHSEFEINHQNYVV